MAATPHGANSPHFVNTLNLDRKKNDPFFETNSQVNQCAYPRLTNATQPVASGSDKKRRSEANAKRW
jgi:hypothetical protein